MRPRRFAVRPAASPVASAMVPRMVSRMVSRLVPRILTLAAALALGASAHAGTPGCSRDILVPVSASGSSVLVEDGEIKGIYPDLLRSVSRMTGCKFVFTLVPRARQVAMYKLGQVDILLPASRTPERDLHGAFVAMIYNRPMLISVASERAPITSARQLLERRDLRVAVVRGYDYGEEYSALIDALGKQGRLFTEVNATAVARLLQAGSADLTIMGPTLMVGAIRRDARVQGLQDKLRTEAIPELPWRHGGAYLSRTLNKQDHTTLREALDKISASPEVMDTYLRYFRADALNDSVRPR
jgi:polar amino acid transport system substrate-binding protein